jgi:protein-tyrosine phosphatase
MTEAPARFCEIEPGLFQGSRPGLYPPGEVDVVVNVSDTPNDFVQGHGLFAVVHCPLGDHAFPGVNWLGGVVGLLRELRRQGRRVFVHCDLGESRSAMVVVAYLMRCRQLALVEALEQVAACNPHSDPNHRFLRGLAEFGACNLERATQ